MEEAFSDLAVSQQHFDRAPCANIKQVNGSMSNCDNTGSLICSKCHLVQYCGRKCQTAHWPSHKRDCNSDLRKKNWQPTWWRQGRQPTFISPLPYTSFGGLRYLWGNVPSYDVLKLAKNEGEGYDQDLALCFAASGDLRNVIESVIALPEIYDKTCACVLNDRDMVVVCRNIVLLLITMLLPSSVAAELVLHVWYSARLTSGMVQSLQKSVKPLIADVVGKIVDKSDSVLLSKTWTFGTSVVSARLYKAQWNFLLAMLEKGHELEDTENSRKDIMLNDTRLDNRDRHLFRQPPSRRLCSHRMRKDGILLPFGSCIEDFSFPNPTLFDHKTSSWMQKDSADPMAGWSLETVLGSSAKYGTPDEDLYGLLYFYVREKLVAFCDKTAKSKMLFHMYCNDAAALPSLIDNLKFDRVEVANIVDRGYLGLKKTLETCGSLLKPLDTNPHAVLIALFMNALQETVDELGPLFHRQHAPSALPQVLRLLPRPNMTDVNHPTFLRASAAQVFFRDNDFLFKRYKEQVDFDRAGREAKMKMREKNTVMDAWPYRFTKKPGEPGAQKAFDLLESSWAEGSERYVEWVRSE